MDSKAITLSQVYDHLKTRSFIDLTHAFAPGIPHWPGFPDEQREALYWFDEGVGTMGSGIFVHRYSHVGQWGTHADPPAHFIRGLRTLDQIDCREMILPLVVLDIHERAARDPDTLVTLEDVKSWESRNGGIPRGCFVALRTDWSKRWPDDAAMQNRDAAGLAHFPGWSREVLTCLYEERGITASGHETTDTNCGLDCSRGDYSLETYILGTNHYQIELLANLDAVPEAGALVVASFPKPKNGSGFPARVFAILP
jgi:kynurenine formamidase